MDSLTTPEQRVKLCKVFTRIWRGNVPPDEVAEKVNEWLDIWVLSPKQFLLNLCFRLEQRKYTEFIHILECLNLTDFDALEKIAFKAYEHTKSHISCLLVWEILYKRGWRGVTHTNRLCDTIRDKRWREFKWLVEHGHPVNGQASENAPRRYCRLNPNRAMSTLSPLDTAVTMMSMDMRYVQLLLQHGASVWEAKDRITEMDGPITVLKVEYAKLCLLRLQLMYIQDILCPEMWRGIAEML